DPIHLDFDLVAGLHGFEHDRIVGTEDHSHSFFHVELLQRAAPDGDLAGRPVDLGYLTIDHLSLRAGALRRQSREHKEAGENEGCSAHVLAPAYLTTTTPCIPDS